jgi:hypothetical protein
MKAAIVLILLFGFNLHGQSIADLARAERKRQAAVEAKTELQKFGTAQAAVKEGEPEAAKKEPDKEISVEQKLQNERVDLIRKRSALLVKLDETKNDPQAAKSIEAELIGLTKEAENLKRQHLDNTAKTNSPL